MNEESREREGFAAEPESDLRQSGEETGHSSQSAPAQATVKLTLQGNRMAALIPPGVLIDGNPVPSQFGENLYQVTPGSHQVSAFGRWIINFGRVDKLISLAPGEAVELWYAVPVLTFLPGRMGHTKQKHRGLIPMIVSFAALFAIVIWTAVVISAGGPS